MFPTGQDFLVPWDKGTEVLSLSQDKGTMGQAQNLAVPGRDFAKGQAKTVWDGILTACLVPRDKRKKKYIFYNFDLFLHFFSNQVVI